MTLKYHSVRHRHTAMLGYNHFELTTLLNSYAWRTKIMTFIFVFTPLLDLSKSQSNDTKKTARQKIFTTANYVLRLCVIISCIKNCRFRYRSFCKISLCISYYIFYLLLSNLVLQTLFN